MVHVIYDFLFRHMVVGLRCGCRGICHFGNLVIREFVVLSEVERGLLLGGKRMDGALQLSTELIAAVEPFVFFQCQHFGIGMYAHHAADMPIHGLHVGRHQLTESLLGMLAYGLDDFFVVDIHA